MRRRAPASRGAFTGPSQRPLRIGVRLLLVTWLICLAPRVWAAAPPTASSHDTAAACGPADACDVDLAESGAPASSAASPAGGEAAEVLLFFWGVGCPHCEAAKPFLEELRRQRPELRLESFEVRQDPLGRRRFAQELERLQVPAPAIPAFVHGERYVLGFSPGTSEAELSALVAAGGDAAIERDGVQTKLFGRLSPGELGLPLFTLALGLLDGFNPCAMWVLLFLLGMLAGQRDRKRMALTAGTFVVASGVVYFAFMAAWLSVFLVIGMTRAVQVVLGLVALVIGAFNVKDFVAFGRGPSFSIPEAAKPGIYSRVRGVLREHSLASSLVGVAALAVIVNLVELLCTAGLPAIYTSVLARQELSTPARLGYIALYNLAYVLDDGAMVTIAVVTLSRRRLAERAGRWLKLVSGLVMAALGLLLLLRPEWLP